MFGAPGSGRTARAGGSCPVCGRSFTGDAGFCPYDGERLCGGADVARPDPLLGTVIDGRYSVEEVLGEGGMGIVYGVRHAALGRALALKAMRRDLASEAEVAVRFTQEAKAAAAIAHPSVVAITDFGNLATGEPYFVMERLRGRPLSRLLQEEGPLPPARVAPVLRQIADALGVAHQAGIVHRDLKPDNVHVAPGDHVKVLDFGLAKVAGTSKLTRAGVVFGTPHYMSPEQAAGEVVDQRSDVYALGVMTYQMLSGRLPFEADSYMGVMTKHLQVEPVPLRELLPDEPGPLEAIVLRCLRKDPSGRYARMEDLLAELDGLVPAAAWGAPRPASHPVAGRPPSGHRPFDRTLWFAAAGAVSTLLALGVAWQLSGRSRAPGAERTPLAPASPTLPTGTTRPPEADARGRVTGVPLAPAPASPSASSSGSGGGAVRSASPAKSRRGHSPSLAGEIVDPWQK